ncbi:MAG TPA: ABC transporter ATP-binding protein [Thermoanaerobaculia bacterium]|jgi:multiple sugar transport system ATP-binding protein
MAIVQTRALTKLFRQGQVGAVVNVDLESREGEFLVLLGPSGSGKTTLLRMIAGLEEPTSGEIFIGGIVVNDLTPRQRRIAMVFQSYALYPHLTVLGNIEFPLKARRMPKPQRREKVQWAADLLGIGQLLARKPRELSGGERQRVALARAIVREPSLFLLDEPLSNLDAKLRASAREELEQFQKRIGTTTIYVTHDQVEAMAMGDRIVVMNYGSVRQIGTPAEVYDDPADTFVATFLGSPPMNLIELPDAIVGFRPEHLHVPGALRPGEPALLVRFRPSHEEYLGAERILYGRLEGGSFDGKKAVARMSSTLAERFTPDAAYDFAIAEKDVKFFDREKGTRTSRRPVA